MQLYGILFLFFGLALLVLFVLVAAGVFSPPTVEVTVPPQIDESDFDF